MHPEIFYHQLTAVPDGELISLTGHYLRTVSGTYLQMGDHRVRLLGEPFSWLPNQHAPVQVWGEYLRGHSPRLLIHDVRPVGAESPAPITSDKPGLDGEFVSLMHVRNLGDVQVGITPDQQSYLLITEELDERVYMVSGFFVTLDPPTLEIHMALALPIIVLPDPGESPAKSKA